MPLNETSIGVDVAARRHADDQIHVFVDNGLLGSLGDQRPARDYREKTDGASNQCG
jgi:hypothetical protein